MRTKDDFKKQTIGKEAIKMIAEYGFDGLSMQKLAKAAKISPSTIYVYFESREDLLSRIYAEAEQNFEDVVLKGFDPNMRFEEGLWIQWLNRYRYIRENPIEFYFSEQFRNSPLIKHKENNPAPFRKAMNLFMANALKNSEIIQLPVEIFWAVAYGAFYTLVKFHLEESTMAGVPFHLTETKLRQTFEIVIKSLKA